MKITLDALPPEPNRRLTDDEYNFIFGEKDMGRVPRICTDILIVKDQSILIAMRNIEPFKGYWTLPGGQVRFGESIEAALARNLKTELGVDLAAKKFIGNIEHYPDGPNKHSISMAYVVKFNGELKPADQAEEIKFFSQVPDKTQDYQAKFLKAHWQEIIEASASI